jgi:hypothetical protein
MSLAITSAGSSIAIGSPPAAYPPTLLSFQNVSDFTEIAEVTDIGEFGKKYNQVTHSPLSTRQIIKRRGSYDNGTATIQYAYAPTDPGQIKLAAALATDVSQSYRVKLQDNTTFYFTAQCMSAPISVGGVDSITAGSSDLEVDSEIFKA